MSIDPEKLLFIFVIAVLVLGPERLPQAARTLGRGLAELRKYTTGFQSEVRQVLAEPRAIIDAAVREADLHPDRPRTYEGGTPATGHEAPGAGSARAAGMDGTGTGMDGTGTGGPNGVPAERRRPVPFTGDNNGGGSGDSNGGGPARGDGGPADSRTGAVAGAPDDPAFN